MAPIVTIYLLWMAGINLATALAYLRDKRAAQRGTWRVPERRLFALNALGGVLGAWLMFFGLRHKTRHTAFWVVQSLCSALHVGLALSVVRLLG